MTRLAGPIRQIGVIVKDIDASMRYWTEVIGAGPFVVFRDMHFDIDYRYRGETAKPPHVSIAVGHSGPLQIELIQQHNDAPSAYRDFLDAGQAGMQHLSPWFSDSTDYEAAYARIEAHGLRVVHEGRAAGSSCRFAYFEGAGGGWPQLEISEALAPQIKPMSDYLAARNADWDGNDPVIDASDLGALIEGYYR